LLATTTLWRDLYRHGKGFFSLKPCRDDHGQLERIRYQRFVGVSVDFFSADTLSALLAIIVIDLVLAGDNAIVIALVARGLPPHLRRRTIVWGTFGAVAIRVLMTLIVVWLLKIPGLLVVGGLFLVWVAYKLLAPIQDDSHASPSGGTHGGLWAAIRTIIVADAVMGIDNVLGVAGAAHGDFVLVVIGLLISVPIMIVGSTFILRMVDRFPFIIYLGSAVLAYTAAAMIAGEPLLDKYLEDRDFLVWIFEGLMIAAVLLVGYIRRRQPKSA
jgi:YjbE family integral membrane protein